MKNEVGRSLYGSLQKTLGGNVTPLGGRPARLGGQTKLLGDTQLDENGLIKTAQPAQVSALDTLSTAAPAASLPTTLAPVGGSDGGDGSSSSSGPGPGDGESDGGGDGAGDAGDS